MSPSSVIIKLGNCCALKCEKVTKVLFTGFFSCNLSLKVPHVFPVYVQLCSRTAAQIKHLQVLILFAQASDHLETSRIQAEHCKHFFFLTSFVNTSKLFLSHYQIFITISEQLLYKTPSYTTISLTSCIYSIQTIQSSHVCSF